MCCIKLDLDYSQAPQKRKYIRTICKTLHHADSKLEGFVETQVSCFTSIALVVVGSDLVKDIVRVDGSPLLG